MKKYILSFLFILIVVFLSGQNYQNLLSPGSTYFTGSAGNLNEYHYDSVVVQGQDSIFYSFSTIHTGGNCASTDLGLLLSLVVRKKPDGWFVFLDRNADSIKFNTQAGLNQSFICRTISGNRTVEGKVISIRQDSVIDTVDQVKEILFTIKNPDGTVFPHVINGTTVILSQHFGFSKTIDFNRFPNDTISYVLIGKGAPSRGLQVFGWKDVYNFEINDEFHYSGLEYGTGGGFYFESIRKILDKTVYGNNDSVDYLIEICTNIYYPGNYDSHDTTLERYNFLSGSLGPALSYAPYEFVPDEYNEYSPLIELKIKFDGKPSKLYWSRAFEFYGSPLCWKESYYTPQIKYEYTPGLGMTYFYWLDEAYQNFNYGYRNLVYFKKGNEVWGTPVATDCNILLPNEEKKDKNKVSICFVPNPVEYSSTIRISGTDNNLGLTISIYDLLGRNVRTIAVEGEDASFSRDGLPSGLFLYILRSDKGIPLFTGRVILK